MSVNKPFPPAKHKPVEQPKVPQNEGIINSIEGLDSFILRVSRQGIIVYCNQAFADFLKVSRDQIVGQELPILSRFEHQPLLEKIQPIEVDCTRTFEVTDEFANHFKLKLTTQNGVLDTVIEDTTENFRFRTYIKKYINPELGNLKDDDLTTFRFPERRLMTVSFTDLRGFTAMSENMYPEEVRSTLNSFLECIIQAIDHNGATVDKLVGDQVMALYGAPRYYKDHALRAIKTAVDQLANLSVVRDEYIRLGKEMPECGIGINTGEMVIGNMGSSTRQDYTALGAAVNLAARLCGVAQGSQIITSESTFKEALKAMPQDWEIIEDRAQAQADLIDEFGKSNNMIPLKKSLRGKTVYIGPKGQRLYTFRYLFAAKFKGIAEPMPLIAVTGKKADIYTVLSEESVSNSKGFKIFGKYRLVEQIGKGGMGDVWKAFDSLGNKVAIKTMLSDDRASEKQIKRFHKEADIMRRLQHRNIAHIFEIGKVDATNYIAMEYIEGATLSEVMAYSSQDTSSDNTRAFADSSDVTDIARNLESRRTSKEFSNIDAACENAASTSPMPIQQSVNLIVKICNAIQYAHEHGVLHRDIKPGNIMIRTDGEAIIMDFGLAKVESTGSQASLSLSGQVLGTIEYMSPEQALSSKDVGEQSDIYSLGAVLYQLVTGSKHFISSGNILTDSQSLQTHVPVSPRKLNSKLDRGLENIILKCLHPEISKRYASARLLEGDLNKYLEGKPVSAAKAGAYYMVTKKIRKYRASLSLLLVIMSMAFIVELYQAQEQTSLNMAKILTLGQLSTLNQAWDRYLEASASIRSNYIASMDEAYIGQYLRAIYKINMVYRTIKDTDMDSSSFPVVIKEYKKLWNLHQHFQQNAYQLKSKKRLPPERVKEIGESLKDYEDQCKKGLARMATIIEVNNKSIVKETSTALAASKNLYYAAIGLILVCSAVILNFLFRKY